MASEQGIYPNVTVLFQVVEVESYLSAQMFGVFIYSVGSGTTL